MSVCVTTYQHAQFIEQCLESVLSQEFAGSLEVLVGDDGSTDGARKLIESIASREGARVRAFFHSTNLGPSANLSFLVGQANGRLIAHLDGDDFWLAGKLAAQIQVIERESGVIAVFSNARVVDGTDQPLGMFNRRVPSCIDLRELLRRGNFLNHSSLIYRAEARDAVLGIEKPYIDYAVYMRLVARGQLAYVDLPLVGYRWRTAGSMVKTMPTAVYAGHLDAFVEAIASGASPSDLRGAVVHFWGKVLVHALISRQYFVIRDWWGRLSTDPRFGVSGPRLFFESLLSFPRAARGWWLRRRRDAVFFP